MDPFAELDRAALARALAGFAERPSDRAELFLERLEIGELAPGDEPLGVRLCREEGFAVRLVRDGRSFVASRDEVSGEALVEALRQVARLQPRASVPLLAGLGAWPSPPDVEPLLELVRDVERELRARLVGFPLRLTVRCHRRWVAVIGRELAGPTEREDFVSVEAETPWGRYGQLLSGLQDQAAGLADGLAARLRCRDAAPARLSKGALVLGSAATAILLHEAVGHSLEADTLAGTGRAEAALGVTLGGPLLDVLDDPASSPSGGRTVDDEGVPVLRRWLLRAGVVEQPLADASWAARVPALLPGAGRRASRHLPVAPRMSHLELLPGESSESDLLADAEGGLLAPEATRGGLDPASGRFEIELPYAWRIRGGRAAEGLGRTVLSGQVAELLSAVRGKGSRVRSAGAGWCAKGGQRLAVWASVPWLRLEGVSVGL